MPIRKCNACHKRFFSSSGDSTKCIKCRRSSSKDENKDEMRVTADVSMENCDGNGSMRMMMMMEIHVCESNREMRRAMSTADTASSSYSSSFGIRRDLENDVIAEKENLLNEETCSNDNGDGPSKDLGDVCMERKSELKSMGEMPIKHDLMWMKETTDVETNITTYDMDNRGPSIPIEEDVKLTEDVNHAFGAMNSKEIDAPAKSSMFALSGCSDVEECPVCGVSLSHLKSLKSQVNHMKRCGKKHGIAAKDLAVCDDEDQFVSMPKISENYVLPQSKEIVKVSRQSVLLNFFQRPKRSINDVLLKGAKRLAKSDKINSKSKMAPNNSNNRYNSKGRSKRGSRWKRKRPESCPAYKFITGTDLLFDGFYYAHFSLSKHYFLSHFHSDHYGGITKEWNFGQIFCSQVTSTLVHEQLGVDKKYLKPIEFNSPFVVESRGKPITVTLFHANHCPGAAMFLFEVGGKKLLHVGDFRWNKHLMMKIPQLRSFCNLDSRLDEIFLDTTYCDPKYKFPSQESVISKTIQVVDKEVALTGKENILFLFGSYTIGKEKVYMSIAKHLGMKIYVDSRRYRILSALQWSPTDMRLLTTSKSEASMLVVPMGHLTFQKMKEYGSSFSSTKALSSGFKRIIGFRPTGWSYSAGANLIGRRNNGTNTIFSVPYSEHSSFEELIECLVTLKPKKIIPTVNSGSSREQIELLLNEVRKKYN